MKKRVKLAPRQSKNLFTNTAKRVHPKNVIGSAGTSFVMRGGIRL